MTDLVPTRHPPFGATWADRASVLVLSAAATGAGVGLGWLTVVAWPVMLPALGTALVVAAAVHVIDRAAFCAAARATDRRKARHDAYQEFLSDLSAGYTRSAWDTWLFERYPHLAD